MKIVRKIVRIFKPDIPDRRLDYVVTGTGRCGTTYMAKLLTSLGFPCTHEAVFTHSGFNPHSKINSLVSISNGRWLSDRAKIVAESSYMSAPYLRSLKRLQGSKIIHLVRDPIRVVFSFIEGFQYFEFNHPNNDPYQTFIYGHIPNLTQDLDQISRACLFYVEWNEMIEKQGPDFFYLVESETELLMDFLGINATQYFSDRRVNGRCKEYGHTYSDIPDGEIKDRFIDMAKRYGYTIIEL
jgi:hypothetical protein